ncbi:MAG: hypothetical protein U9N33_07795 [Campylobacterota bacterium]|nr:hypothetical protein [Campylobacterota bacterium]
MKTVLFLLLFFTFIYGEISVESKSLKELQTMFLKLDIDSKDLDLDKAIKAIKQARKKYPLDAKLKMVDMELEHKRANRSFKSTKNSNDESSEKLLERIENER